MGSSHPIFPLAILSLFNIQHGLPGPGSSMELDDTSDFAGGGEEEGGEESEYDDDPIVDPTHPIATLKDATLAKRYCMFISFP